jgi:ABC-type branched-subunit amino acid transport system substrate-binding protein
MRKWLRLLSVAALLMATLSACGQGSPSGPTGRSYTGDLTFGMFNPFSGPDAFFGPDMAAGCITAVRLINDNGGILGHNANCTTTDTRGDPADAVPAAQKMLATSTNLVGILGPSSDEATATVPIINRSGIPMFVDTGEPSIDQNNYPYYWRITSSDDITGYVLALYAKQKGYLKGAGVFGTDISSQGNVPTLTSGFKKLGGTLTVNQALALDQSSYRTEVAQLIQSNPDVIFTELDPQSAATYFRELIQLHGSLYPIIGTTATEKPEWLSAVAGAVGAAALSQAYVGIQPYGDVSGPAWQVFNTKLLSLPNDIPNPAQWSTDPYTMTYYDGINIMALAMIAAKTPDPSIYNGFITKVADASSGATVVHSFVDGKRALDAGKTIQYVGPGGVVAFNQWHNSKGDFELVTYQTDGSTKHLGVVTAEDLNTAFPGT